MSDQIVVLATADSRSHYPDKLLADSIPRRGHDRFLVFLTNNFDLPALTIARLYKARWQVELFSSDQAAPSNQGILRDKPECREDFKSGLPIHNLPCFIASLKRSSACR